MTACFTQFIGIKGCTDYTPKSGLYISDLEGINIVTVAEMTNHEPNAFVFLQDKISFGVQNYVDFILTNLEQKEPSCISGCNFQNEFSAPSIDLKGSTYNYTLGGLSKLVIHGINVSVATAGSLNITVKDNVKTVTKAFELNAGAQMVDFEFEVNGNEVTIYSENTLGLDLLECNGIKTGCNSCSNRDFKVSGYLNGAATTEAFGFVPNLCSVCDLDSAMCVVLHKLKMGVLYHVGSLVLKEYQASDRLGYMALHGEEWVEKKIVEWEGKAQHFVLSNVRYIEKTIRRIDSNCFACHGVQMGYLKP